MIRTVVLAAGKSKRFGQPKQLVRLDGQTLVRRIVATSFDANCPPIVVVGDAEEAITAELLGLGVAVIRNPDWQEGIGSSIRTGVQHAIQSEAIILLACDQPLVRPKTLVDLIKVHQTNGKPMVASSYANTLGIPALFARSCFPALLALRGDHGAKGIILSRPDEVAIYDFPDGAIDLDTPSDLQLLPPEKFSERIEDATR